MNPLQRRLFRLQQPGMSRQPMGILASSPELMTAAQRAMAQGQPMKAQTGASVNTGGSVGQYMQAIQQLKQSGDKATLNNIATDQRLPRSVQMAAANALSGLPAPGQVEQVAPVSDEDRLAASRDALGALRGKAIQDALTDQAMASIAAGGSPRDGIESIEPRISDSISAFASIRDKARTDALADQNIFDRVQQEGQRGGEKIGERAACLESIGAGPEPEAPAPAPATGSKEKEDKTPDPVTAAENLMGTEADAQFMQISETLGDKDKTNKQKADATDAALGIKGTRKERIEQRYEMLKDILGEEKADDIRTDVGYNLMMTGLMIAAGQSPDAMTNIAGGLAKGLAGFGKATGEAAQEARKEDRALKIMAIKEDAAIEAREAEAKAARELEELKQAEATKRTQITADAPSDTIKTIQALKDQPELMSAYEQMQAAKTGDALEKLEER